MTMSTELGRNRRRHALILGAVLASAMARGVSLLTLFVAVPLALTYLGPERYGLWMTITAITTAFTFLDLGLGNSLVTSLAQAVGREDEVLVRRYISSAAFVTVVAATAVGILFVLVNAYIPWARLYNVSDPTAVAEAGPATTLLFVLLLIGVPLGLVQRVQAGHQRGLDNGLWQAGGNILGLIGIGAVIQWQLGLPWLVLAFSGGPLLALIGQAIVLFGWRYPQLRPEWRSVSTSASSSLLRSGLGFFVIQVCAALALSSDNLVAAQILGAASVAEYSVSARLFSVPAVIVTTLLMPLWPAYGEALARGDNHWVRQTLGRSLVVTAVIAGLPSVAFVIWGRELIYWWVGPTIVPSLLLLGGLAAWTLIQSFGNAVAVLLNGAGIVRFQVICATLLAFGSLMLKIMLCLAGGLPGIAWGGVAGYLLFVAIPYGIFVPRVLERWAVVAPARDGTL